LLGVVPCWWANWKPDAENPPASGSANAPFGVALAGMRLVGAGECRFGGKVGRGVVAGQAEDLGLVARQARLVHTVDWLEIPAGLTFL
jgi:hypothetical protein